MTYFTSHSPTPADLSFDPYSGDISPTQEARFFIVSLSNPSGSTHGIVDGADFVFMQSIWGTSTDLEKFVKLDVTDGSRVWFCEVLIAVIRIK